MLLFGILIRNNIYQGRQYIIPASKCVRRFYKRYLSTCKQVENVNDEQNKCEKKDMVLMNEYQRLVNEGSIMYDPHQDYVLKELDRLRNDLKNYSNEEPLFDSTTTSIRTSVSSFFSNYLNPSPSSSSSSPSIKGVYIHGGVGCGKTFCMNMFYNSILEEEFVISKQKVHFHKFMLNVHSHMHDVKKSSEGDPLPKVVDRILSEGKLICFDEFQVTDVADALILRRLFTFLLERNAVIVATSNRKPQDLYLNGLQRNLFLPFIDLLEVKLNVISMWNSEIDYRLLQAVKKANGVYFVGDDSLSQMEETWQILTKQSSTCATNLETQGRQVHVPKASMSCEVASFSFQDVCGKPLGAADYLVIGENFHTVFLHHVPILTLEHVNVLRRFIIFVDAMYECHVKLIIHAQTLPQHIFQVDLQNKYCDEAFAFDRARSRLEEMSSQEYLKKKWIGHDSLLQKI